MTLYTHVVAEKDGMWTSSPVHPDMTTTQTHETPTLVTGLFMSLDGIVEAEVGIVEGGREGVEAREERLERETVERRLVVCGVAARSG